MTDMTETSLLAYFGEVVDKMADSQKIVLSELTFGGPATNAELAKRLGWSINRITPRVLELRIRELVEEAGIVPCSVTGRAAHLWKVKSIERSATQMKLL